MGRIFADKRRKRSITLGSQAKISQKLSQFNQSFGFFPFIGTQFMACVLPVKQILQAILYCFGKLEMDDFLG